MTTSLFTRLDHQPVAQAELNHQVRTVPRRKRRWLRWINRLFTALVYGTAFILFASQIVRVIRLNAGIFESDFTTTPSQFLGSLFFALLVITMISALTMHFRRMFQTLGAAASSIARERSANNWEMLVLTGIDARKIVRGKWWATVRHMWRPYLMLGILRAALVVWLGSSTAPSYYTLYRTGNTGVVLLILLQFALAGAVVVILTMANLFFTAACGVSAFNKRSGVALARAIGTRLFLLIGCTLLSLLFLWGWMYSPYSTNLLPTVFFLGLLTMFDNGLIVGGGISTYYSYNSYSYSSNLNPAFTTFLPAACVALTIYILLTALLLRFAQWQAVRNGALQPLPRKSSKSAYNT